MAGRRLIEIIEIENHPWFLAVQFHPELKSRPTKPHPLYRDFVGACLENASGGKEIIEDSDIVPKQTQEQD